MPDAFFPVGLRAARHHQRVTATECAALIGVTVTSYHRLEAGKRQMHFGKACLLADRLGISLDALRREDAGLVVRGDAAAGVSDDWIVE